MKDRQSVSPSNGTEKTIFKAFFKTTLVFFLLLLFSYMFCSMFGENADGNLSASIVSYAG